MRSAQMRCSDFKVAHDFYHTIVGLPVVAEREVSLKVSEFANTLLSTMAIGYACSDEIEACRASSTLTVAE